ncbi:MAG: YaaA family protein [Paludibacteraceae bacterium]|nr:YaaA family protein [Paludibacteraceae bacterium]
MQILLANAKIMYDKSIIKPQTIPHFQPIANELAKEMSRLDIDTLSKELDCSRALALGTYKRFQDFFHAEKMPAIMAYNGQAYKHLKANTLHSEALSYGQKHLWITCFLYGLLRPMDAIVPYRMEHSVHLEKTGDKPINTFWKDKLTDVLIDSVKADDNLLIHLSTEEYEHLFDWKRVCEEVTVIHPLFYVRQKNGSLKMQAVWAKSCRGAMVRYLLQNQVTTPSDLKSFVYEGFEYREDYGEELYPHFIREI